MRCSTLKGMAPDCTGTATHMLLYPDPETQTAVREPVCKPCGEGFTRRPRLKGRIVPLHVHMPESAFIEVAEGHRLVQDDEHEARCFDCGKTGSPNWFRFQTNGCPGRPESVTVLCHTRDMLGAEPDVRARETARLWWDYAVDYLHTFVGDWRVVTDNPRYAAYFTFRDREYGVRHDLPDGQFRAEKLPNRGRPEPRIGDPDLNPYNQVVFYFHGRTTESGSMYFATWTPSYVDIAARELVILYAPEGQITEILCIPGLRDWVETTGAICDAFGPISDINLQTRIYE